MGLPLDQWQEQVGVSISMVWPGVSGRPVVHLLLTITTILPQVFHEFSMMHSYNMVFMWHCLG